MLVKSTKFQLFKMRKFWISNVQHDDYSEQYYIVYLQLTKRVNLICSHHKNKM